MCIYCDWWVVLRNIFPKEVARIIMKDLFEIISFTHEGYYICIRNWDLSKELSQNPDEKIKLLIVNEKIVFLHDWVRKPGLRFTTFRNLQEKLKKYITKQKTMFELAFLMFPNADITVDLSF